MQSHIQDFCDLVPKKQAWSDHQGIPPHASTIIHWGFCLFIRAAWDCCSQKVYMHEGVYRQLWYCTLFLTHDSAQIIMETSAHTGTLTWSEFLHILVKPVSMQLHLCQLTSLFLHLLTLLIIHEVAEVHMNGRSDQWVVSCLLLASLLGLRECYDISCKHRWQRMDDCSEESKI